VFADVETQMKQIARGTVDIFPREELLSKLESSRRNNRPLRVKYGIDPTSMDIHIGHAVPILKLRHFQDLGHQAVIIIGDYTAMVGDPSGRDTTRPQLTHDQVLANARTYLAQLGKIVALDKAEVVYNGDWFGKMNFLDVIKLASQMTVARLLERDDFSNRYKEGSPISLHEFIYPLMQGYDSVMVRADVELGGNDQTFNLLVGRQLQKDAAQPTQVAVTLPLLVGLDGQMKMSKSYGNHIGINEPASTIYAKAMSIPDSAMRTYFDLTSDVPPEEMERLLAGDPMTAKMALARSLVRRYHGEQPAAEAAEKFDREVRRKELPEEIPEVRVPPELIEGGKIWIAKLIVHCGHAPSTSEARRLVSQGAVSLDGTPITDPSANITPAAGALLKVGKRKFARLAL